MIRIQSNGIGQQSWALYFQSCLGIIPRFDYSIFADPGKEDRRSYEYLEYAIAWAKENNGIPIIKVADKNLYKDLMNGSNSTGQRFGPIPAFTKNPDGSTGILRRQCTSEYKILEFNKAVRSVLKLGGKTFPEVEIYNAITIDEMERMAIPEIKKFINVYPFCNYSIARNKSWHMEYKTKSRSDCVAWLRGNGFRIPIKSACTFCPYQSDSQWLEKKINDPQEWNDIVQLDYAIRNSTAKGIEQPIYLHRSLKPIDQVYLKEDQTTIFGHCSDVCDV